MFPRVSDLCLPDFTGLLFCATTYRKREGTYSELRRVIVFSIEYQSETRGTLQILGKQIPLSAKRTEGSVETRSDCYGVSGGDIRNAVLKAALQLRSGFRLLKSAKMRQS
jgi:hypothetical protein